MNGQQDNLDIPPFLKRTEGSKGSSKEVVMSSVVAETAKTKKPIKGKPVKAAKPEKAEPKKASGSKLDAFGFKDGSTKSKAAALYAGKKGATLDEVKTALGSVQLNLLKELEGKGFKVKRVKEAGSGKRQVTRYYLSK